MNKIATDSGQKENQERLDTLIAKFPQNEYKQIWSVLRRLIEQGYSLALVKEMAERGQLRKEITAIGKRKEQLILEVL